MSTFPTSPTGSRISLREEKISCRRLEEGRSWPFLSEVAPNNPGPPDTQGDLPLPAQVPEHRADNKARQVENSLWHSAKAPWMATLPTWTGKSWEGVQGAEARKPQGAGKVPAKASEA